MRVFAATAFMGMPPRAKQSPLAAFQGARSEMELGTFSLLIYGFYLASVVIGLLILSPNPVEKLASWLK